MKYTIQNLALLLCLCFGSQNLKSQCPNGLYITEAVYDVCNSSSLGDGSAGASGWGEYFVLSNNTSAAIDIMGAEFDDDGDLQDGDGVIISPSTSLMVPANGCLILAANTQTNWESEYGPISNTGCSYYDMSTEGFESLNNGGDNIGLTGACNNGSYGDVAGDGEAIVWDGSDFILGGVVSTNVDHGGQTYVPGSTNPPTGSGSMCAITQIAITNVSACTNVGSDSDNSNDTFTADVTVTYMNPITGSGSLDLSMGAIESVDVSSLQNATSHTFQNVEMSADGNPVSIAATFSAESSCTFTGSNLITAPSACSNVSGCTFPEVEIVATCTNDATSTEAAQNEYFIKIDITSLGTDTDGDNEVTITINSTDYNYTATGTYYEGPFNYSGSGLVTLNASYLNDGEACSGTAIVSEVVCGYNTDSDGNSDGTADDDLHASGPACNCNLPDGFILAQVAPGSFDASTTNMVYILVDSDGDVVAQNSSGLFLPLDDDTYNIYPFNVDKSDFANFLSAIPSAGQPYSSFTPPSGSCVSGCGSTSMTLDCNCRVDDVAIQKMITSSGPFTVGSKVNFDIIVYNQGTDPIYNVSVIDYLPAELDFLMADNATNDFSGNSDVSGGGTVSATVASTTPIAAGSSYTLSITLTINSSATPGGSIQNDAEIIAATTDQAGNNPIVDQDSPLINTGGGTEDDNNIDDDALDAPADEDDFDFARLQLCAGNCGTFPWDGSK